MDNQVGEKIKALRISLGMTQEELGRKIGVQRAAINKYEKGIVHNIKRSTQIKLAAALKVDPASLFYAENSSPNGSSMGDSITVEEINLIKKYRQLDSRGKETVEIILDREYNLAARAANTTQKQPVNDREKELEEFRANWKREREKQEKSVPAKEKTV